MLSALETPVQPQEFQDPALESASPQQASVEAQGGPNTKPAEAGVSAPTPEGVIQPSSGPEIATTAPTDGEMLPFGDPELDKQIEKAPPDPNVPQDLLADRENWFGDGGYFYNLIANDSSVLEEAKNLADAEMEAKGIQTAEDKFGDPTDAQIRATIEQYKQARQTLYDKLLERERKKIILRKCEQYRKMKPDEAIDHLIKDETIKAQLKQQIADMLGAPLPKDAALSTSGGCI